MPAVLNVDGYRFMIYVRDHPPPHVHVRARGFETVIEIEDGFVMRNRGFNRRDLQIIVRHVGLNREYLNARWREIHG